MTHPPPNVPSVAQLFQDRSIFVTGGTGFMGKVLVEKLLRCCPGISKIYLLVRPKRGQDIQGRLVELINCPLFDKIREERPAELKKIIPIKGDVTSPELGISTSDQQILVDNVSIVFHSAATVKFDEALKLSVTINMLGTKRLVELCHRMLRLEALIHVSTAYCNCDREEVAEVIYPPPYDPERIIEWIYWMNDDLVDSLTPRLIGNRPNTYTFTKALAESMLMKEAGNLPVAIVRPSIVLSSASEPVAGWVDNLNGPTGIIAAAGKGFFRTMLCHGNKVADLIPVDLVVNLMICAAWRTATERPYGIPVYNCVSGQRNPITWKEFVTLSFEHVRLNPLSSTLWYPDGQCRSNPLTNWIMTLLCHTLPAHLFDTISTIFGTKPMMVRVQNKLSKATKCLEYFSTKQWRFRDENVRSLLYNLSSDDRAMFPFDPRQIVWAEYVKAYILGIRHFIFKESPDTLPRARSQIQRLYWLHRMSQMMMVLIILKILLATSSRIRKSWFLLVDIILRLARMLPLV